MLRSAFTKGLAPARALSSNMLAPAVLAGPLRPAAQARHATSSWPPTSLNDPRPMKSGYSWPPSSFSDPSMPAKRRDLVAPRQVRLKPRKATGFGRTTRIVDGQVVQEGVTKGETAAEGKRKARPSWPASSFNVQ